MKRRWCSPLLGEVAGTSSCEVEQLDPQRLHFAVPLIGSEPDERSDNRLFRLPSILRDGTSQIERSRTMASVRLADSYDTEAFDGIPQVRLGDITPLRHLFGSHDFPS